MICKPVYVDFIYVIGCSNGGLWVIYTPVATTKSCQCKKYNSGFVETGNKIHV